MKLKVIFRQAPRLCTLCFLIVILLTATVYADTPNAVDLNQAVDMALKYDFQVAAAQNNLDKTKLALKAEVIKIYPQASVEDSLQYSVQDVNFPNALTVTIKETYPTKFNLYGNKIPTNIEAAFWEQLSSEAQLQITQANVIYNTVSLYINALKVKNDIALQETTVKNCQAALALAQGQLKLGQITKPTELKAESDLSTANFSLEKSRSDYNLALRQLGNQIGLKDVSQLELVDIPGDMVPETIDWQQFETEATQKRLELKQAEITIQKAQRQLAQMENQALPDLSISYNNGSEDQTWNGSISYSFLSGNINGSAQKTFTTRKIPDDPRNTATNNFALKFTWNGDFGTAGNQIAQAKLGLENATKSQQQTLQGIEWDLEQARANYELARQKLENNQQLIPFYQKQLEIIRLQYKQGSATQLDVDKNEASLLQAQLQVTGSKYDLISAYEKLKLVCGELYQFQKTEE